jgi:hypothetical protein
MSRSRSRFVSCSRAIGAQLSLGGLVVACAVMAMSGVAGASTEGGPVRTVGPIVDEPVPLPTWGAINVQGRPGSSGGITLGDEPAPLPTWGAINVSG